MVKYLYDLSQEAEYSKEDLDVFQLVWNNRPKASISDQVIIQTDAGLLMVKKPVKNQRRSINLLPFIFNVMSVIAVLCILTGLYLSASVPMPIWIGVLGLFAFYGFISFYEHFFGR